MEKDFTVYGDECKFGGGKVLREGMGQADGYPTSECLDMVITNALVVDYTGIYKVPWQPPSPFILGDQQIPERDDAWLDPCEYSDGVFAGLGCNGLCSAVLLLSDP